MANAVIFRDQQSYENALQVLLKSEIYLETLQIPRFCQGLVAPVILATGSLRPFLAALPHGETSISGVIRYQPFRRDLPEALPPDEKWREILGELRIDTVRPSISDPIRLRVEISSGKPFGHLIPIMARLIRGGAYRPNVPVLAFEEEHRLLVFSSEALVITRADDLLDFWMMLRSSIDLICAAWDRRFSIKPDHEHRQGIGATEIFKRLPGTNCSKCGKRICMEFAVSLSTGKSLIDQCQPLTEDGQMERRKSLLWFMMAVGLTSGSGSNGSPNVARGQMSISDVI